MTSLLSKLLRREADDVLADNVSIEEEKQKVYRLAKEQEALAQHLLDKASELTKEIARGRRD